MNDVTTILGFLHLVDVGEVSEIHTASILRVDLEVWGTMCL
jgi:hypothetical protein